MSAIAKKEWDSAFFGYPVAAADLVRSAAPLAEARAAAAEAERDGIRLLYLFLPPLAAADRAEFRRAGFRDVGGKVDYARTVAAGEGGAPDPDVVPCGVASAALERLAFQSGAYSRFRLDEGFRQNEFERLYREWLGGSLAGNDGKRVYVAGAPESPRGLLTLEPGAVVRIGLFAVAPECRRQGLGRRLAAAAVRFCVTRGGGELRVATQIENQEACRFYESCGFRKIREESIFHAWLPAPPAAPPRIGNTP